MKTYFFKNSLRLEINVIGYEPEGESIVFFIRVDDNVVFSGMVDCYEKNSLNKSIELLLNNNKEYFDFICWTHPHRDHTVGLNSVIRDYSNDKTMFWMPPFYEKDVAKYKEGAREIFEELFYTIQNRKKNKLHVKTACNTTLMGRWRFISENAMENLIFQIRSFAPDSELLASNFLNGNLEMDNLYSIGLILLFGNYCILLAGDVENRTIQAIQDVDLEYPFSYIKIPHHASASSSKLVDKIRNTIDFQPIVATTTVYRRHKLPDAEVLKLYTEWNSEIEVYSSGDIINCQKDDEGYGIICTSFDILEKSEYNIETMLYGNAISICS